MKKGNEYGGNDNQVEKRKLMIENYGSLVGESDLLVWIEHSRSSRTKFIYSIDLYQSGFGFNKEELYIEEKEIYA